MTGRPPTPPLDGAARLQRQAGAALAGLLRPGMYLGAARETVNAFLHTVMHPMGVMSVEALQDALQAERAVETIAATSRPSVTTTPVLLVHGYVMNRSAFLVMSHALSQAGFRHVRAFNYPQFTHGIPDIARMLAVEVERLLDYSGASRCMIVGHSMGGVIARYYLQMLGGEEHVDTLITLGTPHCGTYTAHFGLGPAAAQLYYRAPLLERLERTARASDVRYISYYSDLDVFVVPAVSAKLTTPALRAINIRVRDIGHLSMLLSAEVVQSVVEYLSHPERGRATGGDASPGHAAPSPPEEVLRATSTESAAAAAAFFPAGAGAHRDVRGQAQAQV